MADKPKSHQFRAMFFKNSTFIKRQKCSLCVQISIPLILVIVLVIVQIWIKSQMSNLDPNSSEINPSSNIFSYDPMASYIFETNPNGLSNIGSLSATGEGSGLLGATPQTFEQFYKNQSYLPYYISFDNVNDMENEILLQKKIMRDNQNNNNMFTNNLPTSALAFNSFSVQNQQLSVNISTESQSRYLWGVSAQNLVFTLNVLNSAFINYVYGTNVSIQVNSVSLPSYSQSTNVDIASLLGGSFYPFALSFILPLFVFSIVVEKQEKLRDLSLMMGLKIRNYWIMNYIFNYLLYSIIVVFVVGVSSAFDFAVFTKGSGFGMFLLIFGWGHAMVSFSFFLSTFFKKTRTASIFCYFLVIVSVNLNSLLSFQVYLNSAPPTPYYFYPLFAFYRGISQLSTQCGIDLCPKWESYTWDFETSKIIFWLYIDAVVYLILALYLDQVLPREFGVPSHPLFFLEPIKKLFIKPKSETKEQYNEKTSLILNHHQENNNFDETIDEDVSNEKKKVQQKLYDPSKISIVIDNLSKHYPGRPKPALDGLHLTIERGEVLGLLGPNGAGKTTTISILTGLYKPTSGTATICGYDIRTDMDSIHRIIGVAMQFDIFWEDLSCVETLLYYARLKGVPIAKEIESVEMVLKEVNLFDVKDRLVKELSGGMKRRLSFAVAMTGDSSLLFFDEPSTGLDPETKANLWETINTLKKNRSIILTTHSMEEADYLSNRIAIVSQGKLQCLGNQTHLKAKFGDGYSIRINIDEKFVDTHSPTELIKEFSSSAILAENYNGSYVYRLPKTTVISDLYKHLVENKEHYHIQEWGLSQTSLEDVFLKISENDDTVN
ncbi:hypothetical protein DICPUDRAFT_87445 [Dictyostelium purpureum]|uniref:ABC transporter domain-containing protein n=1 Tax=Dictyostelium purpureum TaxID=5786 RepID=F0ZI60_DICPU|nr:uncharacterized protein DICPUDRAFT_87445 [Dictyostelium purpureum]EGC36362.1 hypothetical protein DICPUDRAFT_87445 [Dictyostelium purpureum]|eukprot:XP_003287116.1 hypothetical protein DICPUDRAFT_87445 [Dictyostelium purpureum]